MFGRPGKDEAAPYYFHYIDQTIGDNPLLLIREQLEDSMKLFSGITEDRSAFRYAPDRWSIRQVLNHITDTERAFAFRTLWFARGFATALPGYDPDIAASGASADNVSWHRHVEEFRLVRLSTIALFENMPEHRWQSTGVADNKQFTVLALAYIIAGHVTHHLTVLRERYLTR